MEETLRNQLLQLADVVARNVGTSRAGIARDALNDNTFFRRIERGDNFTVKTFDRAVQWFSANWPEGADWPLDVPRPPRTESVEAPSPSEAA